MSRLTLNNNASDPSAPSAGKLFVYSKTDKQLYIEDDTGLVSQLATGGGAAVIGPASAVDNRIAAFDGTTGKLIKDGGILTSALATLAGAQTLTDKTLTAPVLGGTVTGTYTIGGTPTLGSALILPGSGVIESDGDVGFGISTPLAKLHVESTGSATGIRSSNSSALGAASGAGLTMTVPATPSAADQRLGFIGAAAIRTGTTYAYAAGFLMFTSDAWTSGSTPAYIDVETTPSGANVRTKTVRFDSAGNLVMLVAGRGLQLQSGTGARAGDATLVGGTVTVTNTTVTANTKVLLSRKTIGGTVGNLSYTLSAGASFTINSSSGTDTSTITFMLVELN